MSKKRLLTVHCLIRNEENWLWYALSSVLPFADKIIIFDTGSTDKTLKIIESFKSKKIVFKEKGLVDPAGMTRLRQEMLNKTLSDWFMVLDGDEVWPKATMVELIRKLSKIKKNKKGVIVSPWFPSGDVFHYNQKLENIRSPYGRKGYWHARVFNRKIPGIQAVGVYPEEGFSGSDGRKFSEYKKTELVFLKGRYFHLSNLPRSRKDRGVTNREEKGLSKPGKRVPPGFSFPEVFYLDRPGFVPSPWRKFSYLSYFTALPYRFLSFLSRRV